MALFQGIRTRPSFVGFAIPDKMSGLEVMALFRGIGTRMSFRREKDWRLETYGGARKALKRSVPVDPSSHSRPDAEAATTSAGIGRLRVPGASDSAMTPTASSGKLAGDS